MTGGDGATDEAVSCMACGRLLRGEESKRLRIGPRCLRRLQGLLEPRPRRRLRYAPAHPKATPPPTVPVALELWDEDEDEDEDEFDDPADRVGSTLINDVPLTGSYL